MHLYDLLRHLVDHAALPEQVKADAHAAINEAQSDGTLGKTDNDTAAEPDTAAAADQPAADSPGAVEPNPTA